MQGHSAEDIVDQLSTTHWQTEERLKEMMTRYFHFAGNIL